MEKLYGLFAEALLNQKTRHTEQKKKKEKRSKTNQSNRLHVTWIRGCSAFSKYPKTWVVIYRRKNMMTVLAGGKIVHIIIWSKRATSKKPTKNMFLSWDLGLFSQLKTGISSQIWIFFIKSTPFQNKISFNALK